MKRILSATLVPLLVLVLLAGGAAAAKIIKLANAGPDDPGDHTVKAVAIFADLVAKGTGGEVMVQAYHAGKLGDERAALEGLRTGAIQMAALTPGPLPELFPQVMVFDIPFLFSSAPAAWEFFKSDFVKKFSEEFLQKTGVRILAITENGYRHFTDAVRPIRSPADMQGLKIRTAQDPAHMAMVKALGAEPVSLPFGELYVALKQKAVDGLDSPLVLIRDMKFYEVQKYLVLDGHLYKPMFILINEKFFQGMTPGQRKVVSEAAEVLAAAHDGFSQLASIVDISRLKAKGMQIYKPTPAEQRAFRAKAQSAGLKFIEEKAGGQWVAQALEAAAAAEAKVGNRAETIIQDHIELAKQKYRAIKKK